MEKSKNAGKKKKEDKSIDVVDEEIDDKSMFCFTEGELLLGEGERIITQFYVGG